MVNGERRLRGPGRFSKRLRRGVGGVIAIAFLLTVVITVFLFVNRFITFTQDLSTNVRVTAETLEKKIALSKSLSGLWVYDKKNEVLEINITSYYNEPVHIRSVVILYSDGSFIVLNSTLPNYVSALIVSANNEETTVSKLPVVLGACDTLYMEVSTNGKEPLTVSYTTSVIGIGVVGLAAEKYTPITKIYEVKLAPQIMDDGTQTAIASKIESYDASYSDITVIQGNHVSGTIDSVKAVDGDYYVVESTIAAWLEGWEYRRPIYITEKTGYALTNYQVKIGLNSSNFDFEKANSDGSDIRFTLSDGKTLIPYWIEKWDEDEEEAVIWVKVPELPASSTTTIYMYYGNPTASSESNLLNVMESLPASDGSGYIIYYQEWIMPTSGLIGGGTAQGWRDDDYQWEYTLPFTFPYYSSTYTKVAIATNGYIEVDGEEGWSDPDNSVEKMKERKYICPLWENLRTDRKRKDDIYVRTGYSDSYGDGIVFRWKGVFYPNNGEVNVEVVLYSNGLIRFNYGKIKGAPPLTKPSVGVSFGDGSHYTISSYNGHEANWFDEKESLMFWARKKATTEPSVSVGEEETKVHSSITEVTFSDISLNAIKINLTLTLACNITGVDITIQLWNYIDSSWDNVGSLTYSETPPTTVTQTYTISNAQYYIGSDGKAKVRIITKAGDPHKLLLDYIGIKYSAYSDKKYLIIVAGGSNKILSYDITLNTWEVLAEAPFTFSPSTPIAYDHERNYLWMISDNTLYYLDLDAKTVNEHKKLPFTVGDGALMEYYSNCLYILVGDGSTRFYKYDIISDSVEELNGIPSAVDLYSSSAIVNNLIYVHVGGGLPDFYVYNISDGLWYTLANSPVGYSVGLAYDSSEGYLWLIGRYGGLYYYNITENEWAPYETQIPYSPVGPGDRLEYHKYTLYHVRGDGTRDLWIINII